MLDNMDYKELMIGRARIHLSHNEHDKAANEFKQMLQTLGSRGVKSITIDYLKQEYEDLKDTTKRKDQTSTEHFQKRVEAILDWYPTKSVRGKKEMSGLGLEEVLSHFDDDHLYATSKISRLLFNKLEESNDLNDVFDYADYLQRSHQVNHHVLHWAVEIFIIHCKKAKRSGILYPIAPKRDSSMQTFAAMTVTERIGTPTEAWMQYWRNDADLNYHHRHWHSVYGVGRLINKDTDFFGPWIKSQPELMRQGELFAYMHQQMLARYDAERGSWGLDYVKEWDLEETDPVGYNTGLEFHSNLANRYVAPRYPGAWSKEDQEMFRKWEGRYKEIVEKGEIPALKNLSAQDVIMDANIAGHLLEPSSYIWSHETGSIHNSGHMVFSKNQGKGSTYMASTSTAMRDPIFYRWHKRVDNLWHMWNDTQVIELATDAPPVEIRHCDIVMKKSGKPISDFISFKSDDIKSDEMTTFLGPAMKIYEWDNKISHDPFYYHIRFRRKAAGDLNLTFRIFICPLKEVNNRKMWIEMDKFVFKLLNDKKSGVIIRPDHRSSVIKRLPTKMSKDDEEKSTKQVDGFCECGWPYQMLLPRGTAEGEQWRLCVFVSDNTLDAIHIRTSCGSMSFCGASGQAYPDKRPMGYPFSTPASVNGEEVGAGPEKMPMLKAMSVLSNAAISEFVIRNNVTTAISPKARIDSWNAVDQAFPFRFSQPENSDIIVYSPSSFEGRMRVFIDDRNMSIQGHYKRISIRFQGRGIANGSYVVSNATVALRLGTTLNIVDGTEVSLAVKGQNSFEVPEHGVVTDEVAFDYPVKDLFVTFLTNNGSCSLKGDRNVANTYFIFNPTDEEKKATNWDSLDVLKSPRIYCVCGLMTAMPEATE